MKIRVQAHAILWIALLGGFHLPQATAQTDPQSETAQTAASPSGAPTTSTRELSEELTVTGKVASVAKETLVVRTHLGYLLFIYDRFTVKPRNITMGSTVRVTSVPTGEQGVRLANTISLVSPAPPAPGAPPAHEAPPAATAQAPAPAEDTVPTSVRKLERDIERASRKYGIGFRAGASLDPETLVVGVHAKFGPFFSRNLSFRPNVEFDWGEVTKLFAINPEAAFRLPFTPRLGSWSAYVGMGPSFTFQEENFSRHESVDFSNFSFQAGLNIFTGVEFRSGFFVEAKTTVYASPHLRLLFGYTF